MFALNKNILQNLELIFLRFEWREILWLVQVGIQLLDVGVLLTAYFCYGNESEAN